MESEPSHRDSPAAPIREQALDNTTEVTTNPPSPKTNYAFDESQCLFCNQTSTDLDQNMAHMLKAHGLFVDSANLLVDVGSLLAYFHFIISELYECLYCGTQRNTRQAVQQHMMAKGHCKYDITDEDAELREFWEFPSSSSDAKEEMQQRQLLAQDKARKPRPAKHSDAHHGSSNRGSLFDQTLPTRRSTSPSPSPAHSDTEGAEPESNAHDELSTRARKQEQTLNDQLTRLRADDRRSLLHLPASQQRALLITHHKQMEKARRTEQAKQGHLGTAGNSVNCLSKLRLIRKPPHTGNVASLKH